MIDIVTNLIDDAEEPIETEPSSFLDEIREIIANHPTREQEVISAIKECVKTWAINRYNACRFSTQNGWRPNVKTGPSMTVDELKYAIEFLRGEGFGVEGDEINGYTVRWWHHRV